MTDTTLVALTVVGAMLLTGGCASKQSSQAQLAPQIGQKTEGSENPAVGSAQVTRTVSSEVPALKTTELKGDLNRMNETNLEVIGVPSDVAQNIVLYRSQHGGKFNSMEQLKLVPGVGGALYNQLKEKVAVAP